MSIYGAMYSGVSGLAAQSNALGMISDNISNVNSIGYKGTRASFSTLVTQSATSSKYTPGGVRSIPRQAVDRQGLLQASSSNTDLAIAGRGFFVVGETAAPGSNGSEYLFTRAGSFERDAEGNLINSAGYYLQGWRLDANGDPIGNTSALSSLQTLNVASLSGTAKATQSVSLGLNLPSADDVGTTHQVTVQVYDSLGNAHDLTATFTKSATNDWSYSIADPVLSQTGAVSGTVTGGAAGSITFNGDGTPASFTMPTVDITWSTGGANPSSITLNGGTVGQNDGITQLAGDYTINFIDQNGERFGQFTGVSIDEEGTVFALFDNGEQRAIYRIPLAIFANENGLEARNGNAYVQSANSGDLTLTSANSGGSGAIASGALEASTIDLADEFTQMIVTQRAYSANAKIITTADEMLEELIRIRR